jgi:hypothetical protein
MKSLGQTIIRMSNLSSINWFDTHGNGQTDPVTFTGQTQTSQQRVETAITKEWYILWYRMYQNYDFSQFFYNTKEWYILWYRIYQNYELSQIFYNPYPEILYNFPISSYFLNNRYFDFTFIMQFVDKEYIDLATEQEYFDIFHISFIVYDLDEEELLLTSTQDVDF